MFDWKKDRKVLDEGPFEIRVEEAKHNEATLWKLLSEPWKQLVAKADLL